MKYLKVFLIGILIFVAVLCIWYSRISVTKGIYLDNDNEHPNKPTSNEINILQLIKNQKKSNEEVKTFPKNKIVERVPNRPPITTVNPGKFEVSALKTIEEAENYYYSLITKNTITCKDSRRLGRSGDGGWDVCMDGKLNPKKKNCMVYSFGVNYIWEFDDTLSSDFGCLVRTFDPSMTNEPDQMQRSSKVWFYKIGLAGKDGVAPNNWKMLKMSSILKKFKEENKIIDILKIDIEFSEWDSFETMLKEGVFNQVRQILFETHTEEVVGRTTSFSSYIRFIDIWNKLYDIGFRQWMNHWNHFGNYYSSHTSKQRTCCYEHYLINTKLL